MDKLLTRISGSFETAFGLLRMRKYRSSQPIWSSLTLRCEAKRSLEGRGRTILGLFTVFMLSACSSNLSAPSFQSALDTHIASIKSRDLAAYEKTISADDFLIILPNGAEFSDRQAILDFHKGWFSDDQWVMDFETVDIIEGQDMATAVLKYHYRDNAESPPRSRWLTLTFKLENNEWRLVHDQNTVIPAAEAEVEAKGKSDLPDLLEAGWQGQKICETLHENDQMRALRCTFPPGGGHEKHFHGPHFGYILKGGLMKITDAEGTEEVQTRSDRTWWSDGTDWHEVEVLGEETSEYIIVEPKT